MPRPASQIQSELLDTAIELEGRSRPYVLLNELYQRSQLLMVHYANIVETERSVQLSQRMDKAIHDIVVTAATGVASLGVCTVMTAIANGSRVAAAASVAARLQNATAAANAA